MKKEIEELIQASKNLMNNYHAEYLTANEDETLHKMKIAIEKAEQVNDDDASDEPALPIQNVSTRFSVGDKVNYCNGLIFEIAKINEEAQVCYDKKGMWYALVNCKPI